MRQDSADIEKALSYLGKSLEALDAKLGSDRDWQRCRRLIMRQLKACSYPSVLLALLPYLEYLQTEHWKTVRTRALSDAGNRCQTCNGNGELHTHHRTYANLGHENREDLVILCSKCHEVFHTHRHLESIEISEGVK